MGYKDTAEYAFDLMEHFYNIHENQILSLGKENIIVYVPEEIIKLLECKTKEGKITYPDHYRKMEMKSYKESKILFALKEVKNGCTTK